MAQDRDGNAGERRTVFRGTRLSTTNRGVAVPQRMDQQRLYRNAVAGLDRLRAKLETLEQDCRVLVSPDRPLAPLFAFKRLTAIFDESLSFLAVMDTQTGDLHDARRNEVEEQLDLLRRHVLRLQLATAQKLLERLSRSGEPHSLGTRYIMDRWLETLSGIEENLTRGGALPLAAIDAERLESMRLDIALIATRTTDLPSFDDLPSPTADGQGIAARRSSSAPAARPPASRQKGKEAPEAVSVTVALRKQDGMTYIDSRASANLTREVRRMALVDTMANATGLDANAVLLILQGRDPITDRHLRIMVDVLQKAFGQDKVDLI